MTFLCNPGAPFPPWALPRPTVGLFSPNRLGTRVMSDYPFAAACARTLSLCELFGVGSPSSHRRKLVNILFASAGSESRNRFLVADFQLLSVTRDEWRHANAPRQRFRSIDRKSTEFLQL